MEDVTRGLIGRRVCGGIEVGFGILLVIGAVQSANFISILSGAFIVLTGILGTVSKTRNLVIGYLVTGIICAIFLAISLILTGIVITSLDDEYNLDGTSQAILIAGVVIVALGLIVTVLGVIFACLPLCGTTQEQGTVQYNHNTSPNIVGPPAYNYGNTVYPNTKQGPV
ncbi:hypothetical protein HOLleu_11614 [Holothuria leucospilota]|uniref:Uncharacterized protein n=1 Tax=Holothuria leucospilota TaxID=206669 RepID=A0A9Q1HFQ0_HOLLE|nr:hypothetical protein HOLleu_11614 [Holothuria leucospilota]